MMRRTVVLALALGMLVPAAADAQRRGDWNSNPFSFEPYVGAYRDAYDFERDGSDLGWLIGFRAGYSESRRLDLHANLGYGQANDISSRPLPTDPVLNNQWVMLTAGADFALVPGNTSIAVGFDAGVAWRRTAFEDDDAADAIGGDGGWGTYELLAPALTLRHRVSGSAGVFLRAQDMIFDILEGDVEHSPALSIGLSFR